MTRVADVLLIDDAAEGPTGLLAERLHRLCLGTAHATSPEAVRSLVRESRYVFRATIVSANLPERLLDRMLAPLRARIEGGSVCGLAYGEMPAEGERRRLHAAGLRLALWRPFGDETLRFQMNRALLGSRRAGPARRHDRAPVEARAQVRSGARCRDARVYSVSGQGAYLQTSSPAPAGAQVEVALMLPQGTLSIPGQVVHANVPGNLARAHVPYGMGVRFTEPSLGLRHTLESLVAARTRTLEL